MKFNLDDLESIARRVVNEPWGIGDPILEKNSESHAPYLRFLHAVVKEYDLKICLECGVYMGTATRHMALAGPELVIGIDKEFNENLKHNMPGLHNVELIEGNTTEKDVAEAVQFSVGMSTVGSLDLLFLDSEHDSITPMKEFSIYAQLLSENAIVLCDDILDPKMKRFWKWFTAFTDIETRELHFLHESVNRDIMPDHGFGIGITKCCL